MADDKTIFPGGNYVIAFTGEHSVIHAHAHVHDGKGDHRRRVVFRGGGERVPTSKSFL
jgi:hypothetical protein